MEAISTGGFIYYESEIVNIFFSWAGLPALEIIFRIII